MRPTVPAANAPIGACAPLWAFGVGTLLLDQATKAAIVRRLPYDTFLEPNRIEVVPGVFNLVHVGNTGAAWGMFQGGSIWLAALAILTLSAIYWFRAQLALHLRPVQIAFGLLTGGIVGNMLDRFIYGHVVDFLDVRIDLGFFYYIWPTFNVADCGIVVGVILYILLSLRHPQLRV